MQDPNDRESNPIVLECVEDALAPYRDLLPPELLSEFGETLEAVLTSHPLAAPVVERLRPRAVPSHSGEQQRSGAEPAEDGKASGTEGR
jgi:hypothetical protein